MPDMSIKYPLKKANSTKIESLQCNGCTLGNFISNMENNNTKYLLFEFTNADFYL